MLATSRQRPETFAWSPPGIEFKGAVAAEYAHYFDPNATNGQSRVGLIAIDDIFSSKPQQTASQSRCTPCDYR
ncbi:hypothetical protein KIN20_013371 [Parelaphostrongylus tenuis]|uniref:Uncharacterized protein n=1 Tax=Parelaphostrongylus tenuis TaxID=148309 RepID=A0AAD5MY07_PARTN|nr:hypothetical protein KIN20_013371 [Parelaphostrongylus tenuis]